MNSFRVFFFLRDNTFIDSSAIFPRNVTFAQAAIGLKSNLIQYGSAGKILHEPRVVLTVERPELFQ